MLTVRVHYAADAAEGFVQLEVRLQIARRPEQAFDDVALKIGDDHVLRLHNVVVHAARLDDHETFLAVDAAGIAKGVEHQTAAHKFKICFQRGVLQLLEDLLCGPSVRDVRPSPQRSDENQSRTAPASFQRSSCRSWWSFVSASMRMHSMPAISAKSSMCSIVSAWLKPV